MSAYTTLDISMFEARGKLISAIATTCDGELLGQLMDLVFSDTFHNYDVTFGDVFFCPRTGCQAVFAAQNDRDRHANHPNHIPILRGSP